MKRISLKGVAIGNVVDIVATNLVMIPVAIYVLATSGAGSLLDHSPGVAQKALLESSVYLSVATILGGLCSVLGGYVSARIAVRDAVLNGALASILCISFGIYGVVSGTGRLWVSVLDMPLSVALAALGGYLRLRQIGRTSYDYK